jgi:hypothetical protein
MLAMLVLSLAARARADQFVVTDVTYEHSAATTHDSHMIVDALPETPANLRAPVDYASGTAYVRLEVFTKPTDAPTRYQICFNASPNYACTDQAPPYTTTGVYTWATPFDRFWQGDLPDWSRGLGSTISLILKDTMNRKPSPENVGEEVSARYMPTRLRVTVTLVSSGATYVPPEAIVEEDAGADDEDGGVSDEDAGRAVDAGDEGRDDAGVLARDAGEPTRDAGEPTRDASPRPSDASPTRPEPSTGGCTVSASASGRVALPAMLIVACVGAARRKRRARTAAACS